MTANTPVQYFVRESDIDGFHPSDHVGTLNKRLIGPETVGARQLEVLIAYAEEGKGTLPHSHPGIEQVCYMLEGRAVAQVGGQSRELGPGECCFFPAGEMHTFTAAGEERARVLVIYSPPYGESPERIVRS